MRVLYVLLTYLVAPIVVGVEAWRSIWRPEYRGRLHQRFGLLRRREGEECLWIHAVSVGEVQAAAGLVREMRRRHPGLPMFITTVTPTGAQRARALFGDDVRHGYLPYDLPGAVRRFLDRVRPRVVVILETEIWPTLYTELGRRNIPLVIASARLSTRSVDRYRRMSSLLRNTLSHDVVIGAQSEVDAERFRAIGAPPGRVHVTGNVKFDLEIPQASIDAGRRFREAWGASRPVWIAGSTHEGEEEAALAAHAGVRAAHPDALLVLVPRHPQRFEAVRTLLKRGGHAFVQRSDFSEAGERAQSSGRATETSRPPAVFLVDTLGELQTFYAAADIAFVGGSLVPIGGHNLLEPAVLGLPMLSGPYTQNAQDVAEMLQQCRALAIVRSAPELGQRVSEWFADRAAARDAGERGRATVAQSRGAVDRVVALIEPLLSRRV